MNGPLKKAVLVLMSLFFFIPASLVRSAEPTVQDRFALWDPATPFPSRKELAYPKGATDVVVHRRGTNGYDFLHDCAIVEHNGTLLAAWYNCPRGEMVGESVIRPGQKTFSKMWKLRDGPSAELRCGPEWSYPCAIESGGRLHVVYTSEKHHCVLTSIPLNSLAAD